MKQFKLRFLLKRFIFFLSFSLLFFISMDINGLGKLGDLSDLSLKKESKEKNNLNKFIVKEQESLRVFFQKDFDKSNQILFKDGDTIYEKIIILKKTLYSKIKSPLLKRINPLSPIIQNNIDLQDYYNKIIRNIAKMIFLQNIKKNYTLKKDSLEYKIIHWIGHPKKKIKGDLPISLSLNHYLSIYKNICMKVIFPISSDRDGMIKLFIHPIYLKLSEEQKFLFNLNYLDEKYFSISEKEPDNFGIYPIVIDSKEDLLKEYIEDVEIKIFLDHLNFLLKNKKNRIILRNLVQYKTQFNNPNSIGRALIRAIEKIYKKDSILEGIFISSKYKRFVLLVNSSSKKNENLKVLKNIQFSSFQINDIENETIPEGKFKSGDIAYYEIYVDSKYKSYYKNLKKMEYLIKTALETYIYYDSFFAMGEDGNQNLFKEDHPIVSTKYWTFQYLYKNLYMKRPKVSSSYQNLPEIENFRFTLSDLNSIFYADFFIKFRIK